MAKQLTARRSVVIDAAPATIWTALTGPDLVSKAFFAASEEERQHSEQNWAQVLSSIKEIAEG